MTALTDADVFSVVAAALGRVLEIDPSVVTPGSSLADDLGADSLALVEVVELVEEALAERIGRPFRIDDDDLDRLQTVGDAVAYAVGRL
jgi:acyl carrier protein